MSFYVSLDNIQWALLLELGGELKPTLFHIKLVGVHIFVFSHVYSAYLWLLVTERWSFWFWFYSWRQRSSITKVEGIVSSLSRQSHYCRRCRSHPEYKIYEMRKHLNETFFCKKRPASILLQKFDAICRLIKDKDKHFRDQIFGQFCQFRTEVVVLGQKLKLLWYIGNILVLPYRAAFSCWFLCCIWHRCPEQTSPKTNPNPKSALNGAFWPRIHLGRNVIGRLFPYAWRVFHMMDSS